MVRQLVDQIIEYGEVRRGMLGVIMQNLTPELSQAFGLDLHQGVVISQVIEDTAAAVSRGGPAAALIAKYNRDEAVVGAAGGNLAAISIGGGSDERDLLAALLRETQSKGATTDAQS